MAYKVKYTDPSTGYEWEADFDDGDQALEQAAVEVAVYGGVASQAVVNDAGATVYDQAEIVALAETIS